MKTYKNNKVKYRSKKNNTRKKSYTRNIKKYKNNRKIKNFKRKFTKKGGAGESFIRHFNDIAERKKKKDKLRLQIEEELLEKEKYSDKKQHRQNKFNKAFLEDECTICLEDLDDDKGLTQIQKCLKCIDRKDKRLYFTGCEHIFHGRCMDKWLSEDPTCPLCRERVIDNIEEVL